MSEDQKIQKLKEIQSVFRSKMASLIKAKENILKLFRKTLEEKKIEEIKKNIYDHGK